MPNLLIVCVFVGVALLIAPHVRRESELVRRLIVGFYIVVIVRYVLWRIVMLPTPAAEWAVLAAYFVFALEMVATYMAVDDFLLLRRYINRTPQVDSQLDWHGNRAPRIDILIATYNESWEVLEKTIVGATSQNYSNYAVWILDDGNRPWLREKAAASNVGYVTRTDNAHYKAGNLNAGLAQLRERGVVPEFLALLDADFIARPEFLRRTIALMKDDTVGIVQTPQCFYNPDPHQQALGVNNWPDEQRGWFDVYLPSLDALGWATCCGTSCLLRASALEAIGGFPTVSICEDTLTSLKMNRLGWRTVMLSERLTVGLAPEGIGEFLTQRARWLLGGVQNTRHMGASQGIRGRVRYWLTLWRSAIFGIMPPMWVSLAIIYWFTGVSLIRVTDINEAVSYFAPLWLVRLAQGWLFRGRQQPFVSDAIWMLLAPLWMKETFRAVVGSKARFKVTDKAMHRDSAVVHWRLLPFHGLLLGMLLTGWAYTMFDATAPVHHLGFFQANTAMTIWFTLVILAGLAPVIEPPKRRAGERYRSSEEIVATVGGKQMTWKCKDISVGGVLVSTAGCTSAPAMATLSLHGLDPIQAVLVRADSKAVAAYSFQAPELRPALIRKLYCSDQYIVAPERWALHRAVGSFLKRLFF